MDMDNRRALLIFELTHPRHFESKEICGLRDGAVFEEMLMPLKDFKPDNKKTDGVSFGLYDGSAAELKKAVERVDPSWTEYFAENDRVLCAYSGGKIVGFCIVDDMGSFKVDGLEIKLGGPGCVGTVPEYRGRGIGSALVGRAAKMLKDEGFDYSYIHFTSIPEWYERLGYKTYLKWNKNGIIG